MSNNSAEDKQAAATKAAASVATVRFGYCEFISQIRAWNERDSPLELKMCFYSPHSL